MFVAMGLSAAVPVIHGAIIFGIAQLQKQIGLSYVILQGVMYIVGAAIYAVSTTIRTLSPFVFKAKVQLLGSRA